MTALRRPSQKELSAAVEPALAHTAPECSPHQSGLNAHYQLKDLARLFLELRRAAERDGPPPS
jgi:hypothetical protein